MKCPACQSSMPEKNYEGIMINDCISCHATWLDQGEIDPIIKSADTSFEANQHAAALKNIGQDQRPDGSVLSCPSCTRPMETFEYLYDSRVHIDRCPEGHGLFFDPFELEKVQIVMEHRMVKLGKHPKQLAGRNNANSQKQCPRDGSPLRAEIYEKQEIDRCTRCGGVWCDDKELYSIATTRIIPLNPEDFPEITAEGIKKKIQTLDLVDWLTCPTCDAPMERINYDNQSGIVIDRCKSGHGVWLDRNELEQIQVYFEKCQDTLGGVATRYKSVLADVKIQAEADLKQARKEGRNKTLRHSVFANFFVDS